jgi:hypothetical protein
MRASNRRVLDASARIDSPKDRKAKLQCQTILKCDSPGQTIGWYRLDQGVGAIVGALLVLFFWNRFVASRAPAAGDIRGLAKRDAAGFRNNTVVEALGSYPQRLRHGIARCFNRHDEWPKRPTMFIAHLLGRTIHVATEVV